MTGATPEESAFLDALKANPADDTTRLVYADWLDEHNEPRKAEYLRAVVDAVRDNELNPQQALALADRVDLDWRTRVAARFSLVFESFEPGRKIDAIKIVREMTGMGLAEAKHFVEQAPSGFLYRTTLECASGVVSYFGLGRLRISSDISAVVGNHPVVATFSVGAEIRHDNEWHDHFSMPTEAVDAFHEFLAQVMGITTAQVTQMVGEYHFATITKGLSYTQAQAELSRCELLIHARKQQGNEWFIFLHPAIEFSLYP